MPYPHFRKGNGSRSQSTRYRKVLLWYYSYLNIIWMDAGAAEVVLACRDMDKAEKAANEIEKETGNKVTTLKLDLASLASIRASTEQLKARHPSIHILINNAG